MKHIISFFKKFRLSTFEDILATIAMISIMFMMLVTAINVASRYLFNKPITGSLEVLEVVMAILVFFGLARSQRLNIHVGMDLIFDRLKGRVRALNAVRIFDTLLPLFLWALVTYSSLIIAITSVEKKQLTTGILHFPESPFLFTVCLGSLLLCIRFIIQLVPQFSALIKGKQEEILPARRLDTEV